MVTVSSTPTSCRLQNAQYVHDDWQVQIVAIVMFLITFGAHINILLIVKVKILADIK